MEFEIKLAAPDADTPARILADPAVCAHRAGAAAEIPMETTYYDTPDGALGAKRWALRRRLEGGVSVITLKTPAEGRYCRGEFEVRGDDPLAALPALCAAGAPDALAQVTALVPVCGAKFLRTALPLRLNGCTAELALDRGTLFRGTRSESFCEAELELKDGAADAMLALAAHLCRTYGLREEPRSKFARARSL